MIKAVIFDMYETLITHYESPLYFSMHMAEEIYYMIYDAITTRYCCAAQKARKINEFSMIFLEKKQKND